MSSIISLYGGPYCGKSVISAGVYYTLSTLGFECELIPEFAKFLTWENNSIALKDQLRMFSEQLYRVNLLVNQNVQFIILDCGLLSPIAYLDNDDLKNKALKKFIEESVLELSRLNFLINFFIKRSKFRGYSTKGRISDFNLAKAIDKKIRNLLSIAHPNSNYSNLYFINPDKIRNDILIEIAIEDPSSTKQPTTTQEFDGIVKHCVNTILLLHDEIIP
jgi:hypothetical protein